VYRCIEPLLTKEN